MHDARRSPTADDLPEHKVDELRFFYENKFNCNELILKSYIKLKNKSYVKLKKKNI